MTDDVREIAELYRASTGWNMAEGNAIVEAFIIGWNQALALPGIIVLSDNEIRGRLMAFCMRAFGATCTSVALDYGVELLAGRDPIVRQE